MDAAVAGAGIFLILAVILAFFAPIISHKRDITKCIDAVKDRGAEANRVFEDVRAMVRWARGRGDLDENLVGGMRKPSETRERERMLKANKIATRLHHRGTAS